MKKRQIVRIVAMIIAVLLAVGMVGGSLFYIFAADESVANVADEAIFTAESATSVNEVPLLILLASFDADGDGNNDWNPNIPDKLYSDFDSNDYGEQWAGTTPKDHYDRYFGKGNGSLYDYFLEMSCGKFTYVPAKFDNPKEDSEVEDGIISITINAMHPTAYYVKNGEVESVTYMLYCTNLIAKAIDTVDEYIDFSKFDKNRDGKVDETELGLLMISAGGDRSTSSPSTYKMESNPQYYFQVHSAATVLTTEVDDVRITPRGDCNVASIGEYYGKNEVMTIGSAAHELAHTLGAEDLYHTGGEFGGEDSADKTWPQPYNFSLQCDGSHLDMGNTPSYLDPYQRIKLGWTYPTVVNKNGEYTLYSTKSGKYNILLIQTPDENEYFLVEIRMREGFDECIASGDSKGGIIVWHIDDGINKKYYKDGFACTAVAVDGAVHDPGIVPLFRTGWNASGTRMLVTNPSDPFFYLSDEKGTSVFNSSNYCSATKGTVSLNSYPVGWKSDKSFNVHIDVLSEPGEEMKIKLTMSEETLLPRTVGSVSERSANSVAITGSIEKIYSEEPTSCGIILSQDSNPTKENGKTAKCRIDDDFNFSAVFDGLSPETKYYYRVFVETESGTSYSNVYSVTTLAEKTYFFFRMHRNITDNEKVTEVKGYAGKTLSYSFEMVKEGYTFGGWYLDEALTIPYDMNFTKDDVSENIDLYARWVANGETSETTVVTETTETTTTETTTTKDTVSTSGTTSTTPVETTKDTSTTKISSVEDTTSLLSTTEQNPGSMNKEVLVIMIIALAVLALAFITALLFLKKKQ